MMKDKKEQQRIEYSVQNLLALSIIVIVIGIILMLRFGQLSLLKTVNKVDLSNYQHEIPENRSSIAEARRGNIYDQHGQPIAMDTTSYSMYAVLGGDWAEGEVVQDVDRTANVLAQYIDLSEDEIRNLLSTEGSDQVEFGPAGSQLSPKVKEQIEAEGLTGIQFEGSTHRYYINDYFASHLVGYVQEVKRESILQPAFKGELGVEATFDDVLSGTKDSDEQTNQKQASQGQDIYLTLDTRIQNILEDAMEKVNQTYQPKNLGAYLVEVKTGKLIAAGQRPSFNLNSREGIDDLWSNLLVETANEPGSTIKILTMATAAERKVFEPGEKFMSGKVKVYDQLVRDYNLYGWGEITFEEGLARSSNVGMVELVNRIGDQEWVQQLEKFGFGQSTNSLLANETSGSLDFSNPVSRIMSGFGQGFSATPIQLLQAFTTIGNHGEMLKIQYIDQIGKEEDSYQVQSMGQVIDPKAADYVLDIMVDTVHEPYGTAQSFKSNQVTVAAKTGTAQIANPEGAGYLTGENDYYHSVVAYFPTEDPQYLFYLFLKQPTENHGKIGSQMIAEMFHPVVDAVMINQ